MIRLTLGLALLVFGCTDEPDSKDAAAQPNPDATSLEDTLSAAEPDAAGAIDVSGPRDADDAGAIPTPDVLSADTAEGGARDAATAPTDTSRPAPVDPCGPLPPPSEPIVHVTPDDADLLRGWIADAAPNTTFLLADGIYDLGGGQSAHSLRIHTDGIALRGASGDSHAVVLDGAFATEELAFVAANDVTIAHLTLTRAIWHPIHVTGGSEAPVTGFVAHDVRVVDPGQQAIKINRSPQGFPADHGVVRCSHLEMTAEGRAFTTGCYTGGIDAHAALGWQIHDNYIAGFWCPQGLSEHGVHFWRGSRDTVIQRNTIVDCARGIGLGLNHANEQDRVYPDVPCDAPDPFGHVGGLVLNNMISATDPGLLASASGFDAGITLDDVCDAQVLHNTVFSSAPPFSSIEWRFEHTTVRLANNLVSHNLRPRDGATAEQITNVVDAPATLFADPAVGDLHLVGEASEAIDRGTPVQPATEDFDREPRDLLPDPGADERVFE